MNIWLIVYTLFGTKRIVSYYNLNWGLEPSACVWFVPGTVSPEDFD